MSSNTMIVYDEDGDTPDWLEIINDGSTTINLSDYFLSDNSNNLLKWQFPAIDLLPNQPLLIYASGKDRPQTPLHWKTIIDIGQTWKYLVPTSEPSSAWKSYSYAEPEWLTGPSGIGYGDDDDNTVIASGNMSVFMRKKFSIANLENLKSLWLHMDYDDGFVAYINGTEICRAGFGSNVTAIEYNAATQFGHEATIYKGGSPVGFDISDFLHLLNENENVLAIQVHNSSKGSSDLSAIPILSLGYSSPVELNAPVSKYLSVLNMNSHTNFKLSSSGETLIISHADGTVVDSVNYGVIPSNFSFGRDINNIENWGFFTEPTPGKVNSTDVLTNVVKGKVMFSLSDMFVSPSSTLLLSGAMEGELIRFTENGDEPTAQSRWYRDPIKIDRNKVIRTRIFKEGAVPGKIESRTYLIDEKPTVPVISISTDSVNLWDNETGIYVLGDSYENSNPYFGANFWEDWERPASVEMTGVDGKRVFALNCGIKIFGAWSRAHPQKSLAVFFTKEYGDPVLEDVQLFKSKPEITSFKSFVLRNGGNDYSSSRFRDGMMTNLVKDMNTDIQAFEPVVLYLNGKYWGEINMREKVNEDYIQSNHGVDSKEMDILQSNSLIVEGSNDEYNELTNFIYNNSLVDNANYEKVASQIDISNFIDYEVSQIYFNNRDWPGNNIKYWKPYAEDGRWRWILYDTDFGFGGSGGNYSLNTIQFALEPNGPSWPNPPWSTLFLRKLVENQTFKNKFINRFADMLNTTFVAETVIREIDSIAAILQPEIPAHYNRWSTPSFGTWESAVKYMKTFATYRFENVRTHINNQFVHGGTFEVNVSNSPYTGGTITLNTIEIPGNNWKGKYFENVPVSLTAKAFRGHKFDHWEVNGVTILDQSIELNLKKATTITAIYEDEVDDGNSIVINEINYNSSVENDAGDWIELYNWGRIDLDISGWIFKDNDDAHEFVIPQNTILKSNDYLVICRNTLSFDSVYSNVFNILGDLDFGFSSSGEVVRLYDNTSQFVDSVAFGSESPWPVEPNGNGQTLELRKYNLDNTDPISWKTSIENLGTPGRENSITTGADYLANNDTEKQLKIYPNPFTTETRLKIDNNNFEPMNIQIFSMDGRMVRNDITSENEYVWRGDNQAGQKLHPGIYICKVQVDNKIFTGKVILSKQ